MRRRNRTREQNRNRKQSNDRTSRHRRAVTGLGEAAERLPGYPPSAFLMARKSRHTKRFSIGLRRR
jgi:hypothetical protein